MDPDWLLDRFGEALFWLSLVIIFVECGLFFPFLPGDSLLFALGSSSPARTSTCSRARRPSSLVAALVLFTVAAFARQRRRLRDRPQARPAALRARRADPQAEVLRPDPRLLRPPRQQGPGDRPLRAVRAHLRHRRRRRDPDGPRAGSSSGAWSAPCCGSSASPSLGFFLGAAFPALGENIDKAIIVILAVLGAARSPGSGGGTGGPTAPRPTTATTTVGPTATSWATTSTSRRGRRPARPW